MAVFKVPSSSNSPTSSQHSSKSQRSPSNDRQGQEKEPKKRSASPASNASRHSRKSQSGHKDAEKPPAPRSTSPPTMREWLGEYGKSPTPDTDLTGLPDEDSSDESIGSNIVVAHHDATSPPPATSTGLARRTQKILDHENITITSIQLPEGTPAEFRDAGTLQALIRNSRIKAGSPTDKNTTGMPESLCWHVLYALLKATNYLHTGNRTSEFHHDQANWQPIVHNSINPANISFKPGTSNPLGHKTCMLGNFSRCIVLPRLFDPSTVEQNEDEQFDRKEAWNWVFKLRDATGFEAPECFRSNGEFIPGPACDLWSIGAVIVAMMTGRTVWDIALDGPLVKEGESKRQRSPSQKNWRDVSYHRRLLALQAMNTAGTWARVLPRQYGRHISVVVETLISYDPTERGMALWVLQDVERLYTSWLERRVNGETTPDIPSVWREMRAR